MCLPLSVALLNMPNLSVAADNVVAEFMEGKASGSFRLRAESVDADITPVAKEDGATAITLRSRLAYETNGLNGLKLKAEFEDVRALVDDYNVPGGLGNGNADYAVIADPAFTELNEAHLIYKKDALTLTAGRQRIMYDNQRFVGPVGWRQDDQTFDALKVDYAKDKLAVSVAYVDQVNGIFGDYNKADKADILVNSSYDFENVGKLSAYSYMLDNEKTDVTQDTVGLRFSGKYEQDFVLNYILEFATQTQEVAAAESDADYTLIELGSEISKLNVAIGSETLGSDSGAYGFSTDLATKHAFNGWADIFLATPVQGLVDNYIKLSGSVNDIKLSAIFHDFSADEGVAGADDFGSEIDLLAVKKLENKITVGAKLASFSAKDIGADTQKAWLWTEMSF